jgi:hypothetical protein
MNLEIVNFSTFLVDGVDKVYHYTTQDGLLGILRDNCLWATSIRHLNDASEFSYAADLAREHLTKCNGAETAGFYSRCLQMLNDYEDPVSFVASFSADGGDRLSQWRAYSRSGVGYSIGFDVRKLFAMADGQDFRFKKCSYDRVQHIRAIEDLVVRAKSKELVAGSASDEGKFIVKFLETATSMKDPHFCEEHECRLVRTEVLWPETTKFRPGKSMVVPYIELGLQHEDPIAEIVVGPTPHKDLSASTLHALRTRFGKQFNIRTSSVPYRDW